jgi:GntR family transcriptional regulator
MPSENAASPERGEAVADRVARAVRDAIDTGEYPPGALLPSERTLADSLGASVPSVRIGLAILGAQGRIETVNGRGTVVRAEPVPRYLIKFDPADPLHGLTFVTEPRPLRGAADAHTAALLGIPIREFVHILAQGAIHESGALVSIVRVLPHCSYDGMEHYPDPVGPREPIIKALSKARGPLSYEDRHGAAFPTSHDRESLNTPALGGFVNTAAAITRAADGQGLMLTTLRYNPAESEVTTHR